MHHTVQSPKPPIQRALSTVHNQTPPLRTPAVGGSRGVNDLKNRSHKDTYPPSRTHNTLPKGVWTTHIQGRYRHFSIHQLTLYWSCYKSNLITYRQLRILFAASEMAERRNYTAAPKPSQGSQSSNQQPRKPLYTLDELKHLVGGKGSSTADTALRADLKHLSKLGLLGFTKHTLDLATSIDQLRTLGGDTAFFWTMFNKLDHKRRPVPIPRRVVRAIAGHFNPGTTAVVLATLVRGMFWRKQVPDHVRTLFDTTPNESSGGGRGAGGIFRIDNRTKREWIVEVFGISPRTVTNSRKTLIELGWLIPQDTPQWLTNRYGTHDAINPAWSLPTPQSIQTTEESPHETPAKNSGESASPQAHFSAKIASPDLNQNSSPTGNLNTRTPAPTRAGTAGVSLGSTWKNKDKNKRKSGSRKKNGGRTGEVGGVGGVGGPNIRNITNHDLADTGRLLSLHAQAVKIGLASATEAGRLDFLALAQRARMHGKRAGGRGGGGALFFYLLREKKTGFITMAAEDEALRLLKDHLYGTQKRVKPPKDQKPQQGTPQEQWGGRRGVRGVGTLKSGQWEKKNGKNGWSSAATSSNRPEYSKDEQFVIACMRVAQKHRIGNAFRIAHAEGWTRDRWNTTVEQYEATKFAIRQSELMQDVEE